MRRRAFLLFAIVRLLGIGVLLIVLRYILKTPQPLESMLSGESRLFRWTHGHIFYKVLGKPDAPPLVVVHAPEIGGSSYEFRMLVEHLAQYFSVYALDLLGFGLSDRPYIEYTGETYTTLCQDFLTQVVRRPAILVASGLSCGYALAIASTQPQLCDRLVLLTPHTLVGRQRQNSLLPVLQQPFVGLCVYAFLTMRIILRAVITQQVHTVSESELRYIYACAHQLGAQYAANAFLSGQLRLDVSRSIETLRTPTLLIYGANTSSVDESVAHFYVANDVVEEALIQDAGLRPHQEQPTEVVTRLLQWYLSTPTAQHMEDIVSPPLMSEDSSSLSSEEGEQTQESFFNESETRNTGLAVPRYTKEDVLATEDEQVEAYCVKCKEKRIMQQPTDIVTKNGRNAKTGTCPVCGSKLFRFVAS